MWTVRPVTFEWIEETHGMEGTEGFKPYRKENGDYVYGIKMVMEFLAWKKGTMFSVDVYEMTDRSRRTNLLLGACDVKVETFDIYDNQMSYEDSLLCQALQGQDCRGDMALRIANRLFQQYCRQTVLKKYLPLVCDFYDKFDAKFAKTQEK